MMQFVIALTPVAPGMGYAASALSIIGQIMNCRHAILIRKLSGHIIGPLKITWRNRE